MSEEWNNIDIDPKAEFYGVFLVAKVNEVCCEVLARATNMFASLPFRCAVHTHDWVSVCQPAVQTEKKKGRREG